MIEGDGRRLGFRHARGARRHAPHRVRRARRGAVPHVELHVRQRGRRRPSASPTSGDASSIRASRTRRSRCSRIAWRRSRTAEACIATSSGMSAILTTCIGLLNAGDHIVASRSIFGATVQLFNTILSRFGIATTYVDPTDPARGPRRCDDRDEAALRRDAVEPDGRDRRHRGAEGGRVGARRAAGRRQLLLHAGAADGRSRSAPTS